MLRVDTTDMPHDGSDYLGQSVAREKNSAREIGLWNIDFDVVEVRIHHICFTPRLLPRVDHPMLTGDVFDYDVSERVSAFNLGFIRE